MAAGAGRGTGAGGADGTETVLVVGVGVCQEGGGDAEGVRSVQRWLDQALGTTGRGLELEVHPTAVRVVFHRQLHVSNIES